MYNKIKVQKVKENDLLSGFDGSFYRCTLQALGLEQNLYLYEKTMESILVRTAVPDDAEAMSRLSLQLGYAISEKDTKALLNRLLQSPDDAVFVADCHHELAGWIHVFRTVRLESGIFCEIGGLITEEKFRGKGIGRMLVVRAREWAMEKGVSRLVVRSNSKRNRAHEFYLRNGFTLRKTQHIFECEI